MLKKIKTWFKSWFTFESPYDILVQIDNDWQIVRHKNGGPLVARYSYGCGIWITFPVDVLPALKKALTKAEKAAKQYAEEEKNSDSEK